MVTASNSWSATPISATPLRLSLDPADEVADRRINAPGFGSTPPAAPFGSKCPVMLIALSPSMDVYCWWTDCGVDPGSTQDFGMPAWCIWPISACRPSRDELGDSTSTTGAGFR